MIKKIIFFVSSPLSKRDYKRFGIEILRNNGFEVDVFDFTPMVNPLLYHYQKKAFPHKTKEEGVTIVSRKDGYQSILTLTGECFVVCLMHYRRETFWIYKALSNTKVLYAIDLLNNFPSTDISGVGSNRIFKKKSQITLPKIINFINNYRFRPSFAKYLGIRGPKFILAGGESSLNSSYTALIEENTEILWLHCLDYDIYLDHLNSVEFKATTNSNKALFIDGGGPQFSGDELIHGRKCILSKEKYYPSLCRFFDVIENKLDVSVEIAAHPQSDHENRPYYFGQRLVLHDMIFKMIMQSKIVITHASTAVNIANILKKPVIFITTDEFEADTFFSYSVNIRSAASWFGKKPINIDHNIDSVDFSQELLVDEICYHKYKNAFIKKDGSEDLPSWQILANRLKEF